MSLQDMAQPATKGDVAFAAAHASLAIREIAIALMALNAGDKVETAAKIKAITKQADELYAMFQKLTGSKHG
jgi:hypothetical protein